MLTSCNSVKSQSIEKPTVTFEDQLTTILNDINNAGGDFQIIFEQINKLKRLSNLYPNEWLSNYYVVLLNLKISMGIDNKEKKELLIKEARETLDKLLENESAIESEVLTLDGFYYYALIAKNPQENGQLYYKKVIDSYQKAINIDSNNPRPVLMLLVFQKKMSNFNGENMEEYCEKLKLINQLIINFKPKSDLYPKWGMRELEREQQENCK
jgi:tetratricopeptide (TPR) repeat protein